jgi:UDP-N-acetylmuramoyl-L-alanyl-D-glutamate--2,6-diaminopimelate ligase
MGDLGDLLAVPPGARGLRVRSVTADSRAAAEGALFVAIPGRHRDGRRYIADAVARGAAAVLAPVGTAWPPGVPPRPLIEAEEPRLRLAQIAARLAGPPPPVLAAVTGTNGKTSTVDFLRQIWTLAALPAASLGTLGVISPRGIQAGAMTTPDPVTLCETLARLAREGVGRAALEASSHGLDQFRLDGLRFTAAGFTNLTRDHLDYHGDLDAYRAAKLRLFSNLLAAGGTAVASTALDEASLSALRDVLARRGIRLLMVGDGGDAVRLLRADPLPDGQALVVQADGRRHEIAVKLPGRFQADNALVAAALAQATGVADPWALLPKLRGVRGRMELAATLPNGACAYVDYAHTPDALQRLLTALRPHTRGRLVVVFGAGGDRDPGKRPLMGAACAGLADLCIVTDDNPRSESPAAIRAAVLAGCPGGVDGGERAAAIARGLEALGPGDVLAVAGKGHEQGQTIGGATLPFDDVQTVRHLAGLG